MKRPKALKTPAIKRAELEHERLTSLINSMADGVIAIDENAKIVLYNGAALNILDLNSSMHGKSLGSVVRLIDKENRPVNVHELVLSTKISVTSQDYRLVYPDKSMINLYMNIAPVRLGYGQEGMKGYVILIRDITMEKSLEEERDEFISVISHELRTPVAIAEGNIGNAIYMFEKGGSKEAIREALKQAHEQTNFLAGLINDLATLSRAEHGALNVDMQNINAHDLIIELSKEYAPQAAAKGLVIKTALDPNLELLRSSKLYVREILQNLITNAIKYTETGTITIGAKFIPDGVAFVVEDTGIGISKRDQKKIFEKFFRSEDYRTRKSSGTGLGLYVVMKLSRLLKAHIDLESEPDKGSTFTIYIPSLQLDK